MKIGVVREIKEEEYRVAITPSGVREFREHGHEVLIEAGGEKRADLLSRTFPAVGIV